MESRKRTQEKERERGRKKTESMKERWIDEKEKEKIARKKDRYEQ